MSANGAQGTTVEEAMGMKLLDEERFVKIFGDNDSFKKRVISVFIDSAPKVMAELESAYNSGDGQKISSSAHTLKGSAGNIGGERCAALAKVVELAARNNDSELIENAFPCLKKTFDEFSQKLSGMIAQV